VKVLTSTTFRCPATGKVAYVNEAAAMEIVERSWMDPNWVSHHGHPATRAFECDRCGFWHLTSKGTIARSW
jgi:hypothetical protein